MRRPATGRPARSTPVPLAVGLLLLLLGLLLQRTTTATTTVSTSTPSPAAFAPPPPRFGRRSFIAAQHQQNLEQPRPRHQRAPPAFASPSGADAPLLTRAEIEAGLSAAQVTEIRTLGCAVVLLVFLAVGCRGQTTAEEAVKVRRGLMQKCSG